jgi:hypothetical protein
VPEFPVARPGIVPVPGCACARSRHDSGQIQESPAKLPKGVIAVAPPSFRRERALIKRGVWPVAGCDEAGRGPLAGPVVAAAVVLDPKRIPKGIDDSKRLTPERREELFEEICATASFAVAFGRRRGSIATISCAPRCGRWRARCTRCRKCRSMCSSMAATGSIRPATATP